MEHLMADRLALDVAARTGSLALPGLPFGNSDNFRYIPGTIYVRLEVLIELYKDVLLSIVRGGFDRILCIAYHIPNQPALERAAQFVRDQTGVSAVWINPGAMAATYLKDFFDDPTRVRGHGAEPGLSLCRYITAASAAPQDYSPEPPPSTYAGFDVSGGGLAFRGYPVDMPVNWEELYPTNGGYGDATKADPEIGRQMYERIVEYLCGIVAVMQSVEAGPAGRTAVAAAHPNRHRQASSV
jgi:creatinine amidohydrolase/Fe(II)-dependent formamide hydrolase-like protein